MHDLGNVLTVIGIIIILVSCLLSWYRGMNDEDLDKSDMFWGWYLIEYPIYTLSLIIGIVLFLLGKLLTWWKWHRHIEKFVKLKYKIKKRTRNNQNLTFELTTCFVLRQLCYWQKGKINRLSAFKQLKKTRLENMKLQTANIHSVHYWLTCI